MGLMVKACVMIPYGVTLYRILPQKNVNTKNFFARGGLISSMRNAITSNSEKVEDYDGSPHYKYKPT